MAWLLPSVPTPYPPPPSMRCQFTEKVGPSDQFLCRSREVGFGGVGVDCGFVVVYDLGKARLSLCTTVIPHELRVFIGYIEHRSLMFFRVKEYLQENNPDRVADFEKAASKFVKDRILPNFKNWQFFQGTAEVVSA